MKARKAFLLILLYLLSFYLYAQEEKKHYVIPAAEMLSESALLFCFNRYATPWKNYGHVEWSDIQHNLKYAEAMTRDKVEEDGEENPLLAGLFKAHHALSLKAQMWTLLGIFWAIALLAIARRISRSGRAKNILIGSMFAISSIFCIIAMSAGYKIFVAETEITGVVTAKDADVTSAPSDKSQTLNTLSEGTSFEVISEQGNFVEIRLGEKVRGFVKQGDVGIVK